MTEFKLPIVSNDLSMVHNGSLWSRKAEKAKWLYENVCGVNVVKPMSNCEFHVVSTRARPVKSDMCCILFIQCVCVCVVQLHFLFLYIQYHILLQYSIGLQVFNHFSRVALHLLICPSQINNPLSLICPSVRLITPCPPLAPQCSSPLPGLRTQETCCRGIGKAWGISECTLCPTNSGKYTCAAHTCTSHLNSQAWSPTNSHKWVTPASE